MLALEAGVLAMFLLEAVKFLVRKFLKLGADYDFPALYYSLLIPFLTALVGYGLGFIGWAEPVVLELASIVQWAIAIVVQLASYHMGLKPLKDYVRSLP
jgi:hypothetical protein